MAKILLVEDNELNRDMLSRRLSRHGHVVVIATDGRQAIALTQTEKPELILMDLRLPDMSGLDVTRLLKSDEATRGIPVIALTAYAMEGDRESALGAGCDDYDTKPVEMPRLLGKIDGLLGR